MQLCKVTGSVVATIKDEALRKGTLLIVHPIETDGTLTGVSDQLAIDPGHGAGVGDVVLVAKEGAVVRQILGREDVPANAIILGVVDDWMADI